MRCQKLMWRNMMRSTKNPKTSVLYYSIDMEDMKNNSLPSDLKAKDSQLRVLIISD